jgi:hypothetical protein
MRPTVSEKCFGRFLFYSTCIPDLTFLLLCSIVLSLQMDLFNVKTAVSDAWTNQSTDSVSDRSPHKCQNGEAHTSSNQRGKQKSKMALGRLASSFGISPSY